VLGTVRPHVHDRRLVAAFGSEHAQLSTERHDLSHGATLTSLLVV
jgi:hypothetical protein